MRRQMVAHRPRTSRKKGTEVFVSSFSEIIDCIGTPDDCGAVVVGGHVNPDGDCTGSVLALTLALKAKGFDASPVLADEGPADGPHPPGTPESSAR